MLLIGVVVVILVLDVLVDDYDVSTAALVPLLLTVTGLLSVDLPRLKSGPASWTSPSPTLPRRTTALGTAGRRWR